MAMTSSKCTDDMTFKAVTSDNKSYYKAFKQYHCNKSKIDALLILVTKYEKN